jgi:hypothetical protein
VYFWFTFWFKFGVDTVTLLCPGKETYTLV